MSYRRKLIIAFILISLVPMTVAYGFISFNIYNTQRVNVISNVQTRIESDVLNLNAVIWEHSQKLQIIRRHPRIQAVLRTTVPLQMNTALYDFYFDLQNLLHAFGEANPTWSLVVYSFNPNVVSGRFIRDLSFMDEHAYYIATTHLGRDFVLTTSECVSHLYILRTETNLEREIFAISQISISFERLRRYFSADYPEGTQLHFILTSREDEPIHLIGEHNIYEMGNYYIVKVPVLDVGYIVGYIPEVYFTAQLLHPLLGLTAGYLGVIIIFAFLTVLISRLLSGRLERLLSRVSHDIDKLIETDDGQFIIEKGTDEFARINGKFVELISEIKRHYEDVVRIENEKKGLELELLQSLINPHFLYNSLGSIKITYDDTQLSMMVDDLIKFYRIALSRGNSIISIAQEVEMARLYLDIQKFAYEAEFSYKIDINDNISKVLMPKNILQPLVENALIHGIERRKEDFIEISAYFDGDYIILTVKDNGAGMDSDRLQNIMTSVSTDCRDGYGLFNVMQRVKLFYGDDCGLHIESEKDIGTTVYLKIKSTMN